VTYFWITYYKNARHTKTTTCTTKLNYIYNHMLIICLRFYCITGIIRERKCSRIVFFFLIHEKTFANGDSPLRIYGTITYIVTCHAHFSTKFATVETLWSSMHQCSSYSGHIHLQLLNCVIHSNTEVECLARVWLRLENFEPAPIWFVLERLQKSGGLQ